MLRYFLFSLSFICVVNLGAQEISGEDLLNKSISFHDPNNIWPTFKGTLHITMKTPEDKERVSDIDIDLDNQYFKLSSSQDGNLITQILDKGNCTLLLNGSTELSEVDIKTHRLDCDRTKSMKNYYTYLYGLPMKLKDPGTIMDPKVERKIFKGKEYLVLKVKYEEKVGTDTWYFYFNPQSFAMEIYQFYHDEAINDGEYILLSGLESAFNIKMPKTRAWFYNKNDKYLGTDVLTKVSSF